MRRIAISACILALSASCLAAESDILASNNQASLAYLSTTVDYTETGRGIYGTQTGILDTETGPVRGVAFSLDRMRGPGHEYLQLELDQANGSTTYTGSFMGGQFGSVVGTSTAILTDISARYGRGFAFGDVFMATPYAEAGHHLWYRGVNYGETYTHLYVGVGVLAQYSPVPRLVLAANVLRGRTVNSYISVNSGPGLTGFSGPLGNSVLFRIGAVADYALAARLHASLAIDHTRFEYGISGVYSAVVNGRSALIWEPDSKTRYTTIKIGMGVAF